MIMATGISSIWMWDSFSIVLYVLADQVLVLESCDRANAWETRCQRRHGVVGDGRTGLEVRRGI